MKDNNMGSLLLFGEYTMGYDSHALVIPVQNDSVRWEEISELCELQKLFSSLKNIFSQNASGTDAGMDPLQFYAGKPVLLSGGKIQILPDDFLPKKIHIGLLDTKLKSDIRSFKEDFNKWMKDRRFLRSYEVMYLPCEINCVEALVDGDEELFFDTLHTLSYVQSCLFKKMIPERVFSLFTEKYDFHFDIKLLGAGGGGYMLLFTDDIAEASKYLGDFEVQWI